MLDVLLNNQIIQLIVIVFAVIGLPCTLYFGLNNPSKRQFSCSIYFARIIQSGVSKLKKLNVLYENNPVDCLSSSTFALWNSGKIDIRSTDIASGRELKIKADDKSKILDARILKCSDETNAFAIKKIEEKEVEISFDFVNENEGVLFEIIHNGGPRSLNIDCKIKGGKEIKIVDYSMLSSISKVLRMEKMPNYVFFRFYLGFIILMMLIALFFTTAIYSDSVRMLLLKSKGVKSLMLSMAFATGFWAYALILLLSFGSRLKKVLGLGIPSTLRKT